VRVATEVALPFGGLAGLLLLAAVVAGRREAGPAVWALTAWCGALALRDVTLLDGMERAATWVAPWWVAAAIAASPARADVARRVLCAGAVPLALWWGGAALFGPATLVEHGAVRWIGPYANPHNAALTLAALAAVGLAEAPRRPWGAAVAALSLPAVALTGVRTAWLFLAIAVGVLAWRRGRRGLAVAGVVVGCAAVAVSRRADVLAVVWGVPPPGGWGALGTGRLAIWRDAWAAMWDRGVADWLFGLGMGGHLRLARPFDPHAEWMSLWFQAGAVGVALWGAALVALFGRVRRGEDRAAVDLALALLVAATVVDLVSNGVASRPTPAWVVFGLAGAAVGGSPRPMSE
jgi:O-antigen ligase